MRSKQRHREAPRHALCRGPQIKDRLQRRVTAENSQVEQKEARHVTAFSGYFFPQHSTQRMFFFYINAPSSIHGRSTPDYGRGSPKPRNSRHPATSRHTPLHFRAFHSIFGSSILPVASFFGHRQSAERPSNTTAPPEFLGDKLPLFIS